MEQAVAFFSEPSLLLFVQLKTSSALSAHQTHFPSSHIQSALAMKLHPVSETRNRRSDAMFATNVHIVDGAVDSSSDGGVEDRTCPPGVSVACSEIWELLRQWLAVHSLPDAVEIVDNMPFTKHGKFTDTHTVISRPCKFRMKCKVERKFVFIFTDIRVAKLLL